MFQEIKKILSISKKCLTFISKYAKYVPYVVTLSFLLRFTTGVIMFFENLFKVLKVVGKVTSKLFSFFFRAVKVITIYALKFYHSSTTKVFNIVRKIDISSDDPNLKLTKRTSGSVCFDIPISSPIVLPPHEITVVRTPFKVVCLDGVFLKIYSRSGLAAKNKVALFNGTGIIDSDYRGYINLIFVNMSNESVTLGANSRVAQMMVCSKVPMDDHLVASNESFETIITEREGGLGSTTEKVILAEEQKELKEPKDIPEGDNKETFFEFPFKMNP